MKHKQKPAEREVVLSAALSAKSGDEKALEELFGYMAPAIIHSRETMKNGKILSLKESMTIGHEAVMVALEKFDIDKGNNFWSYAYRWIRNHLKREILDRLTPMYIPSREYHIRSKVLDFIDVEMERTGKRPTVEEMSKTLGEPKAAIKRVFQSPFGNKIIRPDIYLGRDDVGITWDNNAELGMLDSPSEDMCRKEDFSYVIGILRGIVKQRTFEMICMHYGLLDMDKMTLENIGNHFGISRQAVESHIKRSMDKLRRRLRKDPEFSKVFWL